MIDFTLSNLVNSGVPEVHVITEHKSRSLTNYLEAAWMGTGHTDDCRLLPAEPPAVGRDSSYLGTADAVFRNLGSLDGCRPDLVLVFSSDQVYAMDVGQMIRWHLARKADVTVAAIPKPVTQCHQYTTISVNPGWQVRGFEEKPLDPPPFPGATDHSLVSMDNYIFNYEVLREVVAADAADIDSRHDFRLDILPRVCQERRVYAYDFRTNTIPGVDWPTDYWREVETLPSYFRACMEINDPLSHLPLFHDAWPLRSYPQSNWPAKIVGNLSGKSGCVENSILGSSTIVAGAYVRDSVIGPNVRILSRAVVEECVILGNAVIGEGARIKRAIIDEGNIIGSDEKIGHDRESDLSRYFVDKSGLVVVPGPGLSAVDRGVSPWRTDLHTAGLAM